MAAFEVKNYTHDEIKEIAKELHMCAWGRRLARVSTDARSLWAEVDKETMDQVIRTVGPQIGIDPEVWAKVRTPIDKQFDALHEADRAQRYVEVVSDKQTAELKKIVETFVTKLPEHYTVANLEQIMDLARDLYNDVDRLQDDLRSAVKYPLRTQQKRWETREREIDEAYDNALHALIIFVD